MRRCRSIFGSAGHFFYQCGQPDCSRGVRVPATNRGFQANSGFYRGVFLADFVNGLAHMYMDNADDYVVSYGPLIAAFHQHHRVPAYKIKPIVAV